MTISGHLFIPQKSFILSITQGMTTTIEFTEDHDYVIGEILSFRVSPPFGMVQLNNLQGRVLSLTPNTVTVDVNSFYFNPFIYAGTENEVQSPAMAVPSSSGIIPGLYPATVTLQDAFDNVRTR